ncbi:phytoene desaturase family protein [Fodinibius sediminis]|uniref:Phytoene desaturase n=1 Tax=Fodinibius sediminis TaxID=1214077 RepID=A0A521AYH2_9BACT|nr:phytoene desaturase family protein [Fodinibius sediminis]SMO39893.1 phytoene desaturase [Fodinibius sediminis]
MKVIVIGAGLGGLATSCLLAYAGHQVTVLEKNDQPGGKINEIQASGYRFDTGPSLLTMPFVLESLFERCGADLEDYLAIKPLSPICRYFYKNGNRFDCYQDACLNTAQIQTFAPEDLSAYRRFMEYSRKLYHRTKEAFLFNPLYGFSDIKSLKFSDFLKIDAFKTVDQRVDRYFESPELRKFFKRFATYNGSSPYQAPATLNVIPHVELSLGGYYIPGGIYRLIKALVSLAGTLGVTLTTGKEIRRIVTEHGRAVGVERRDGQLHPADIVVSNADAHETYLNILDSSDLPLGKKKKLTSLEPSCSGFVLLLGINKTYPQLVHHNIFFSENYEREFEQIFKQQQMPEDPTIYVANTSHSDPGHAPQNGSNLFVLVNAPYLNRKTPWEAAQAEQYSNLVIRELERRGLEKLKDHICYSKTITPSDFYRKYRSNKGSIYGTSSNSRFSAFLRPRNKSRSVEGLYLVGGSTHPGGGIPLVVLSAFHAAELIGRYERS